MQLDHSTTTDAPQPRALKKRQHRPNWRRPGTLIETPIVRHETLDGEDVVYVALHGRGWGREMLLDAADWEYVRDEISAVWTLSGKLGVDSPIVGYVSTGRKAAAALANQRSRKAPLGVLARILTNSGSDQVVRYRNFDSLDLRRCNLFVVSRAEFLRSRQ